MIKNIIRNFKSLNDKQTKKYNKKIIKHDSTMFDFKDDMSKNCNHIKQKNTNEFNSDFFNVVFKNQKNNDMIYNAAKKLQPKICVRLKKTPLSFSFWRKILDFSKRNIYNVNVWNNLHKTAFSVKIETTNIIEWAVTFGHNHMLNFFIKNGFLNDIQNDKFLIVAIKYNNFKIVENLVNVLEKINVHDSMLMACRYGRLQIIEFFIRQGIYNLSINDRDGSIHRSQLYRSKKNNDLLEYIYVAAKNEHYDVVEKFIEIYHDDDCLMYYGGDDLIQSFKKRDIFKVEKMLNKQLNLSIFQFDANH